MANELAVRYAIGDIKHMAETVVKSKLFGLATVDAAMALMLLCESEGIHPMRAVQEFDIIQGKPALKSQAMLARLQKAGGSVKWITRDTTACEAEFSHPQGGTVGVKYTMEDAARAGLANKDNWKKNPRQMLAARVVSEGVRAVYPACLGGLYTPEEVVDFGGSAQEAEIVPGLAADTINKINAALTLEDLSKVCGEARQANPKLVKQLTAEYRRREAEIKASAETVEVVNDEPKAD